MQAKHVQCVHSRHLQVYSPVSESSQDVFSSAGTGLSCVLSCPCMPTCCAYSRSSVMRRPFTIETCTGRSRISQVLLLKMRCHAQHTSGQQAGLSLTDLDCLCGYVDASVCVCACVCVCVCVPGSGWKYTGGRERESESKSERNKERQRGAGPIERKREKGAVCVSFSDSYVCKLFIDRWCVVCCRPQVCCDRCPALWL